MRKNTVSLILFSLLCTTFIKTEPFSNWEGLANTTVEDFVKNDQLRKNIIRKHNEIKDEDRAELSRNKEGKKHLDIIDKIGKKAKQAQDILDHDKRVNDYKDGNQSRLRDTHSSFFGHLLFGDGTWGDRWNQFNAAREAQSKVKERQKVIKEMDPSLMGEDFIKTLKSYEIEALQPWQIKRLCEVGFRLKVDQVQAYKITAFTPKQIGFFTPDQIKFLDFQLLDRAQREALTKNQIQALTADQIEGVYKFDKKNKKNTLIKPGLGTLSLFTPEQISWFTPKQVGLWTEGLLKSLRKDQIQALNKNQLQELNINKLSDVQIGYLTDKEISNLKLQQIKDIKSLSAFSVQQIQSILSRPDTQLSEGQILSISTEKLNQLDQSYLEEILTTTPRTFKTAAKLKDIQEILNSHFSNL